jgi:hypothetical protein
MFVILALLFPSLLFLFIIVYFFCRNKASPLNVFIPYGLSYAIQALLIFTCEGNNEYVSTACLNIFMMAEFLAFTIFIRRQIKKDSGSRIMSFFLQLFPLASCYYWLYNDALYELQPFTLIIQFMIIATGCLFYYDEIFEEPPDNDLNKNFNFWMVNGMLIVCCLSLPLSFFMSGEHVPGSFVYGIFYSFRFLTCILVYVLFHTSFNYRFNLK